MLAANQRAPLVLSHAGFAFLACGTPRLPPELREDLRVCSPRSIDHNLPALCAGSDATSGRNCSHAVALQRSGAVGAYSQRADVPQFSRRRLSSSPSVSGHIELREPVLARHLDVAITDISARRSVVAAPLRARPGDAMRLLTADEVASRLGVQTSWVSKAARANRIPHVCVGRYRRFRWPDIEAWLEDQRRGS